MRRVSGGGGAVVKGEAGGGLRVAVDAAGAADVDYVPWLAVLDAEVGRCGADEFEWCGVMQGDDCFPLFVCHLYAVFFLSVTLLLSYGISSTL